MASPNPAPNTGPNPPASPPSPPASAVPPTPVVMSSDATFVFACILAGVIVSGLFVGTVVHSVSDKALKQQKTSFVEKEKAIADREKTIAEKEAKLTAIEDSKKTNVEIIDVEENGTIHIKRHETVGPFPVRNFTPCEEGEIPLTVPEPKAAPAEPVKETPQAQAPPKPKVDWPSETIDGTVEKVPPPVKKPATAAVQRRWKFLCRNQWGCEYWEEVPVARPQATPASRDIRHPSRNLNEFQMR